MSLYQLITNKLTQAGFHYEENQLKEYDIIEYMVLESAGALFSLQGKPLKCIYREGHTSNIMFSDDKKRSALEFGLKNVIFSLDGLSISKEEEISFIKLVKVVKDKFPESVFNSEHRYYNMHQTLYSVIILEEDIEKAVKSSSVFEAAGDLSKFDLEALILLKKKLNLYKIADENLSILIDQLINKINTHISSFLVESNVQQELIEKKFTTLIAIRGEEKKFNQFLDALRTKLNDLINKGTKVYKWGTLHSYKNKEFDSSYLNIVPVARYLMSTLLEVRDKFFDNPVSNKSFNEFKKNCLDVIENSKVEFAKYRGWAKWYNELNPILQSICICVKAIGGILAGIIVVPALLTEIYSEQGYIGTFFNTKTDSLRKLEIFQQALCTEEGFFDKLDEKVSSMGASV